MHWALLYAYSIAAILLLPRAFGRRAHAANAKYSPGTVLGLAIVLPVLAGLVTLATHFYPKSDRVLSFVASTGNSYEIAPGRVLPNQRTYIDRTYGLTSIPAEVRGYTIIRTANHDKATMLRNMFALKFRRGTVIYVAFDNDLKEQLPAWLVALAPSGPAPGLTITNAVDTFALYRHAVDADTSITFGGNATASSAEWIRDKRRGSTYFVLASEPPANIVGAEEIQGTAQPDSETVEIAGLIPGSTGTTIHPGDTANHAPAALPNAAQSEQRLLGMLTAHNRWLQHAPGGARLDLHGHQLDGLAMNGANVAGADMIGARMPHASFVACNMQRAEMVESSFFGSGSLIRCNLARADMRRANMSGVQFNGANLENALLVGTRLDSANFSHADMAGVVFEPASLPDIRSIAEADNLERMTYVNHPSALVELRSQFEAMGYEDQRRRVTAAIERQATEEAPWFDRNLRRLFFGFTCEYGVAVWRPLVLFAILLAFFLPVYIVIEVWRPGSACMEEVPEEGATAPAENARRARTTWYGTLGTMIMFTVLAGFTISHEQFNVSEWILRLLPTERRARARGGARVISGIHAIAGFYLVILWLLLYLKNPFE